jgi:hypothetical protein
MQLANQKGTENVIQTVPWKYGTWEVQIQEDNIKTDMKIGHEKNVLDWTSSK